jgi:hypothetical protein
VVTVFRRPGWGAWQAEKSYDGECSPMSEWRDFPSAPYLAVKKKTWWQLAPRCCWNRSRSLTRFLSASVTRKDLQFGTRTDLSFQRHYRFRPTTWDSRSGKGFISTPTYTPARVKAHIEEPFHKKGYTPFIMLPNLNTHNITYYVG